MQYKVKTLAFIAKNSPYTISPGIYEASSQSKETWDYLLKLGSEICEVIIEKEVAQVKPKTELNLKVEVESEPKDVKLQPKKRTQKNQIQGDN